MKVGISPPVEEKRLPESGAKRGAYVLRPGQPAGALGMADE
ncbi:MULTISPECIES: hypothetical protein [Methylobacteriaceae]|nr:MULTISPECIES: hypothetical protein [Methylobacteriaceae]AMB44813.1 hypothetical protein Y590_07910 [Methylobacterium sp. AMS5]